MEQNPPAQSSDLKKKKKHSPIASWFARHFTQNQGKVDVNAPVNIQSGPAIIGSSVGDNANFRMFLPSSYFYELKFILNFSFFLCRIQYNNDQ